MMGNQRIHQSSSWNTPRQAKKSPFAPRPFAAQTRQKSTPGQSAQRREEKAKPEINPSQPSPKDPVPGTQSTTETPAAGLSSISGVVVQRNPDIYKHSDGGELKVNVSAEGVFVEGTMKQMKEPTGLFSFLSKPSLKTVSVSGQLDFHKDANEEKRLVIGTISCQPKRTGAGTILVLHMAKYALENGYTTIGTDLSALEEGTPEFYQSIGLKPTEEKMKKVKDLQEQYPDDIKEENVRNMLWADRLDGQTVDIFKRAMGKMVDSKWKFSK